MEVEVCITLLKIMISQKSKCPHGVEFPIFYRLIQNQSRSMSDPSLSDIDFKTEMAMVRTNLKNILTENL